MQLSLDITVHHFAATSEFSDYARKWTAWHETGPTMHDITCQQNPAYFLCLRTHAGLTRVDDDWWSTTLELQGPNGQAIGQRPALIFGKPYDIPVYVGFKSEYLGMFSVGLRTVAVG